MYPEEMVLPMKAELSQAGFQELHTAHDVEEVIKAKGTTLVVVNSVCGCAAANARPGARMSLQNTKKPDHIVTVFAGVDQEATQKAREYTLPYPPSSPSIALFKDGELVHFVERHHIEGRSAALIAQHLEGVFEEFC